MQLNIFRSLSVEIFFSKTYYHANKIQCFQFLKPPPTEENEIGIPTLPVNIDWPDIALYRVVWIEFIRTLRHLLLQKKEQKEGNKTSVHSVELTEDFSHNDLVNLLLSTGRSRSNGLTLNSTHINNDR